MILITELADSRDPSSPYVSGLLIEVAGVRVLVDPGGVPGGGASQPLALTAAEWLDAIVGSPALLIQPSYAACKTRCRNKSKLARPYIPLFSTLRR